MGPEQIRARLTDISARLQVLSVSADMSQEIITEMNALNEEFSGLDTQLTALENTAATLARSQESTRKVVAVNPALSLQVGVDGSKRHGGFATTGEFFMAVKNHGMGGQLHKNLMNVAKESIGEDGGFLVPEEISTAITKKLSVSESLWSLAKTVNVAGNSLSLKLDESQPWNAGVQAYWIDENQDYTLSKPKFSTADFKLKKLGVYVTATDELLEDATALQSYIQASAPEAIMHKINGALISGNGVGKPEGILNSGMTITVAKEVGQAADSLVVRNITKMYSAMIPSARAGASWFINAGAEQELLTLKDDNGNFIYLAPGSQLNGSPYGMLMGRPVIPMMSSLPALGDSGDLIFANFGYYYGIQKAGIKSNVSIHAEFIRDVTAFKFSMRLDGRVPFKTPVTTEFGGFQMSAFVKLADRP